MKLFLRIFLLFSGFFSFFWGVFADNEITIGDCSLVQETVDSSGYFTRSHIFYHDSLQYHQYMGNVLQKHEFNRALLNLQTVCCSLKDFQKDNEASCSTNNGSWWAVTDIPQSVYLFDHFFDILMRKLDGKSFYSWGNRYPAVSPDPVASGRYTTLAELKTNENWSTNTWIDLAYNTYRKKQNSLVRGFLNDPTNQDPNRAFFNEQNRLHNQTVMKNYADSWNNKKIKVNLRDRYLNVCNFASYFYFSQIWTILNTNAREKIVWNCQLIVNKRTWLETQSIIQAKQSSNLRYLQTQSQEAFHQLRQRNNALQSTFSKITTSYSNVIKLSQKITPNCK